MLPLTIDALDTLPESIHEDYKKGDDGKYHLTVAGLRPESDFAKQKAEAAAKERELKLAVGKFAPLGDRDPKEILAILDRVPELEEAAKGGNSEEKINSLVEARIKSKLAPLSREKEELLKELETNKAAVAEYMEKERVRAITDNVRKAATASKVLPEAVDDLVALASSRFNVGEDGSVTTQDGLTADMWLKDIQDKKPFYWPPSQGGGARGGSGGSGTVNPFLEKNWNLTEQAKLMQTNPSLAAHLAKVAGVELGDVRPPTPK